MNLDTMNARQLRALKDRIDAVIADKQAEAKAELAARFRAMAADAGLSLADITGKPAKGSKLAPKWRDKTTGVLWSGKGRMPNKFDKKRAERIG